MLAEDLKETEEWLNRAGIDPQKAVQWISAVSEDAQSQAPILDLKQAFCRSVTEPGDRLERLLLHYAAQAHAGEINRLPVADDVKRLIREEHQLYVHPRKSIANHLEAGDYAFVAACRMATLRRFPAGPMDWEVSGFARRWLLHVPPLELPRVLWFVATSFGGFAPAFFMHVASRPRNRGLVIEKEVLRGYYRIARSMEKQPAIKGLIAAAWFHDARAEADNRHLEWLNRPYREGGLLTTIGLADAKSGFTEHNERRREQYEKGALEYRIGLALWPREAAIRWANSHTELGSEARFADNVKR